MKRNLHFAGLLFLAGLIIFSTGFLIAWFLRPILQGDSLYLLLAIVALVLIGAGFTLNNFIQAYVLGTRRLTEETRVIVSVNPAHRVDIETPSDIKLLGDTINSFADRFQAAIDDQTQQVEQARATLEEEKNRLAALMSELTEGVIVCNLEGQILLYNNLAKQMLRHNPGGVAGGYVGLGRSIFGLIDRNTITHVVDELTERQKKGGSHLVSQVVISATNGQLIRTRVAPILSQLQEITGYVLTLEDVTQQTQRSRRRDVLLQTLTEGVRASLANIRTAIETIAQYPEMDPAKMSQLRQVIYDEALALSGRLNQITTEHSNDLKAGWQLEDMTGTDLLWAIQRYFEDRLQVSTSLQLQNEHLWLKVDGYSVIQAMTHMMARLQDKYGINEVKLRLKQTGQLAALDLAWNDGAVELDQIWSWQNESVSPEGEPPTLTLREVAERHGGEVWCQTDKETGSTYLRLLLTITEPKQTATVQVVQGSRPEYYDFDLFHQPGQTPELDQRSLAELTYTVFDTETTGLNPDSDEIISMSAVRILNNRLLRQEIFDQLVDPRRRIKATTTEITGISQDMLAGQPTIEQVLPSFHRFTEGTVLIAHNAAFDMKMLQLKETQTGVRFANPVLDTLLLSAVTHANSKDHSLEAIAQRLGVNIFGRHTSLGDAMVTGEIFLKLIPLLAEQGIVTLADARTAAEQTYLARVKY